jgi:hypothetical protein
MLLLRFGIDELFHRTVCYKEAGLNCMSARNFPENVMAAQLIIQLPVVLEPERLLSCSRKSATASYPEIMNKA